jgi:hypothetical protein
MIYFIDQLQTLFMVNQYDYDTYKRIRSYVFSHIPKYPPIFDTSTEMFYEIAMCRIKRLDSIQLEHIIDIFESIEFHVRELYEFWQLIKYKAAFSRDFKYMRIYKSNTFVHCAINYIYDEDDGVRYIALQPIFTMNDVPIRIHAEPFLYNDDIERFFNDHQ